ncbi:BAG family molecular chaperone regulator 6 [Morus notabilis]|uniref:BAG family molecular chaperone regulator 6 n=1 Tax=Morus notabilis TaxID=981085 RepID=W9R2L7_9ROSA|nr:BAG family molecular chaperone regulator 6 [Morus notabilis]EXB52711.1 BAG family molecular chaperone regulator 6 [Morus notabilis]
MMPVYRYMDSYPHQGGQTGYQTFPTYIPVEPPKSAMVYESWPNGGSYGYPMPPSHSCCNHGNFPGFRGFRPSYPQPMQSPVHFCGGYPMTFPVYYVPPPHYSSELPRYEFDKNMPGRYECCGRPNHPSHQRGDSGLRIEEEEPDVVEKKGNESLAPVQTRNYPYPVVWIPPEYVKEQPRPFEPKVEELESFPHKTNQGERKDCRGEEPKIGNGCLPLDADKIKYLINGGDGKRTQDQKSEEQKKDFQFPVIWMPSYDSRREESGKKENKDVNGGQDQKSEDQMKQFPFPIVWLPPHDKKREMGKGNDCKEINASSNFAENPPYIFKLVPMRHLEGNNNMENCKVNEENHASKNETEMKEKTATQRNIPVKHVDPRKEDKSEETEKKGKVFPVKQVEETITSNPSGDNDKKQSSSSPRSSKLPPVCLRVDPLPKKKNESSRSPSPKKNGSSRSPSPPSLKERSEQKLDDAMKASVQAKENTKQASVQSPPGDNKEVETKKREAKEIPVVEKTSDGPKVSAPSAMHTSAEVSEKSTTQKMAEPQEATDLPTASNERKLEKKTLSDVEAAVLIQSAYRGFEVRRSEPIKKLKQRAEVREQVADVRSRIQALESSSDTQRDAKQKLLIEETIMRLLLKLDAIQGLHPSLRDIRKSLAKELVTLQEKLDTIAITKSEQPKVEVCPIEPVEPVETKINECKLEEEKQEEMGGSGCSDMVHSCGDKLLSAMDSEDKSKSEEALLSRSHKVVQHLISEDNRRERVASDLKPQEPNSEAIMEHKDEVRDRETDTRAKELMETEGVNNASECEQAVEVSVKEDENNSDMPANSFEAVDGTCADDNVEMVLDELPVNVIDEEHVESEKDEQAEMEKTTAYGAVSSEATLPGDTEGLMSSQEEAEMSELAELPVGVIDEDSEASVEMDKNGDLLGKESEFQSTIETPNENEKSEEGLEENPKVEMEECVKIEYEENQKLPVASVPEEDNEGLFVSKSEELQPVISMADEQSGNAFPEDECMSANTARGKDVPNEEKKHLPSVTPDEVKETQEMEVQAENQLEFASGEKMEDKLDGLEIANNNEEVSDGSEFTPLLLQAEHEGESLLASPTCSQMSTDEHETKSQSDKWLTEENEKLREMMEKLIEAGKQQLNVITNLNGRVKDLEKKLSRKKKLGTKPRRSAACGTSRLKRSNLHVNKESCWCCNVDSLFTLSFN